jgi:hypothetical protein
MKRLNLRHSFALALLFALLVPVVLIYYLSVGARHRLIWHVALLGGLTAAVVANLFWLIDWLNYWWIRAPLRIETNLISHRTLHTLWEAPLWGSSTDRALAVGLFAAAALGVIQSRTQSKLNTAQSQLHNAQSQLGHAQSRLGHAQSRLARVEAQRRLINRD